MLRSAAQQAALTEAARVRRAASITARKTASFVFQLKNDTQFSVIQKEQVLAARVSPPSHSTEPERCTRGGVKLHMMQSSYIEISHLQAIRLASIKIYR